MGRHRKNTVDRNLRIDRLNKAEDKNLYILSSHAGQRLRDRFIHHVDVRDTLYRGKVSVVFRDNRYAFKYEHKCYKVIVDRRVDRTLRLGRRKPRVVTVTYTSKFSNVVKEQLLYFDVDMRKLVTTLTRVYDDLGEGMYGKGNKAVVMDRLESFGLKRSKFITNASVLSDEPVMTALLSKKSEMLAIRDRLMRACDHLMGTGEKTVMRREEKKKVHYAVTAVRGVSYVHVADKVQNSSDIRLNLIWNTLKNERSFEVIDFGEFKMIRGAVFDLLAYEYRGCMLLMSVFEHNNFKSLLIREASSFKSEFKARVALRELVRVFGYSAYANGKIDVAVCERLTKRK